jgi:nucleotide-binding universal stress UspA family protein
MEMRTILVPVDDLEASVQALHWAVGVAATEGVRVLLLHVVSRAVIEAYPQDTPGTSLAASVATRPYRLDLEAQARLELQAFAQQHRPAATPVVLQVTVAVGTSGAEILRVARADGADLIVMGTHGRTGRRHAVLGSVAEGVLR